MQSVIARNADHLAQGGIRTPAVAAPIAFNMGVGGPSKEAVDAGIHGEAVGPGACIRWGSSVDMNIAQLNSHYASHAAYVAKVRQSAADNVAKGYLLKPDADKRGAHGGDVANRRALNDKKPRRSAAAFFLGSASFCTMAASSFMSSAAASAARASMLR